MSEELKKALEDLLKPANKDKAFSFGYVTGKRKDKNGEGELEISRKPKIFTKSELEKPLLTPGNFCTGTCWADEKGKILLFDGTGVATHIANIKKTANKLTNKSYKIESPSEDEARRGLQLNQDGEASTSSQTDAQTRSTTESPDKNTTSTTSSTTDPTSVSTDASLTTTTGNSVVDSDKAPYDNLLTTVTQGLKTLTTTNPTAAAKIQHILNAAADHAKPGEYGKALAFLTEANKALTAAIGKVPNTTDTVPVEDKELGKAVLTRWVKYSKDEYPDALKLDRDGRLKTQHDKVDEEIKDASWAKAKIELDKLEKLTEIVHARDEQSQRLKEDPKNLSVGVQVGKGSFGTVSTLKSSGNSVPLVFKTGLGVKGKEDLQTEVDAYALLGENEHIAKCYGIVNVGGQDGMVMESLEGGGLDKAFEDLNRLKVENQIDHSAYWGSMQRLFTGMVSGLAHMEEKGFAHNDLKGDNVMFDTRTMQAKLIDVGMSSRVGEEARQGHEFYRAPEKLAKKSTDPLATDEVQDSYSVGQMLHEQGERKGGPEAQFAFGKDVRGKGRGEISMELFAKAKEFIDKEGRVLQPTKPGAEAGESGKYAEGYDSAYVDFLEKMMHPDPTKRLKPSDALKHPFLADPILTEDEAKATLGEMMDSRRGHPSPQSVTAELKKAKDEAKANTDPVKAIQLGKKAAQMAQKAAEGAAKAGETAKGEAEKSKDGAAARYVAAAQASAQEAKAAAAAAREAADLAEESFNKLTTKNLHAEFDNSDAEKAAVKAKEAADLAEVAAQAARAGQPGRESDIRTRVAAELKKYDTVKSDIKKIVKSEESILKDVEKAEEAIDKAKPGAEALKKASLDQLKKHLQDLKAADQGFFDTKERVLALSQDFDELVSLIKDDPARAKSVGKDLKNGLKLSKMTRLLISAQGQIQHTLGTLNEVLAEIEESGNKGVANTDPGPGDPEKVRKAAEKLAKQLPKWETKLDADVTLCLQTQQVAEAFQKLVDKAKAGGPAVSEAQMTALKKQQTEIEARHGAFKTLVAGQEDKIAEFDEVASGGTRKEKGRSKRKSAASLAKADQNLLIAVAAIGSKIKRARSGFEGCIITLDDLMDQVEGTEESSSD